MLRAGSGNVTTSAGNGFRMTVDSRWVEGAGYRPVWVDLAPAAVRAGDRTLHVELTASKLWSSQHEVLAGKDIELPAGSTGVTAIISVPQHFTWQAISVDVWEDGRHLDKLSQSNMGPSDDGAVPAATWWCTG
jgi:hypothetical protein